MRYAEEAFRFAVHTERLIGITALPERASEIGVLIIVGGPQYRVGSHRQFVSLARSLAAAGYTTMRFDVRGMGDGEGEPRNFENISNDIGAAIDTLCLRHPSVRHIILWGLCDAASAALLYWDETRDVRVAGMTLANPWVRTDASLARTHVKHYYGNRLLQADFWLKLAGGHVNWRHSLAGVARALRLAMPGSAGSARRPDFRSAMADAWRRFPGPIGLILSGRDYTAREFIDLAESDSAWNGALDRKRLSRLDLADADHTFSSQHGRREVEKWTVAWLEDQFAADCDGASAIGRGDRTWGFAR